MSPAPTRSVLFDNLARLDEFARRVDVVTYEFENVPVESPPSIWRRACPVRPGAKALAVAQDRIVEKTFIRDLGIPVAPFAAIARRSTISPPPQQHCATGGGPAILKTARLGYDGKGQVGIARCHRGSRGTRERSAKRRLRAGAAPRFRVRDLGASWCAALDGTHRLATTAPQRAWRRHSAPLDGALRSAAGDRGAGPEPSLAASPRRSTMSACSASKCSISGRKLPSR